MIKKPKKSGLEPAFQVHYQEGDQDGAFSDACQLAHHPAESEAVLVWPILRSTSFCAAAHLEYESEPIRVVQVDDGKPWWIVGDVCVILGLGSPHKAIERLDEDERKTFPVIDATGKNQETWCTNELCLYSLILRSYKPKAKKFERWITHEVLPALRSTGKYEIDTSSEIDLIIRSAQALKNIKQKRLTGSGYPSTAAILRQYPGFG